MESSRWRLLPSRRSGLIQASGASILTRSHIALLDPSLVVAPDSVRWMLDPTGATRHNGRRRGMRRQPCRGRAERKAWKVSCVRSLSASVTTVFGAKPSTATRDLTLSNPPVDGPQVCLLYESEAERDELSRRLREAKLDELPWEFVDVRPPQRPLPYLEAMQHSFGRISDALRAGSVAARVVLSSRWTLVGALMLSPVPLFLMLRLTRGLNPPRVMVAE